VGRAFAAYQDETGGRVWLQYGGLNRLVSQIIISALGDLVLRAEDAFLAVLVGDGRFLRGNARAADGGRRLTPRRRPNSPLYSLSTA